MLQLTLQWILQLKNSKIRKRKRKVAWVVRRYKIENCTGLFEVGGASAARFANWMIKLLRETMTSTKGSSDSRFRSTLRFIHTGMHTYSSAYKLMDFAYWSSISKHWAVSVPINQKVEHTNIKKERIYVSILPSWHIISLDRYACIQLSLQTDGIIDPQFPSI